MKSQSDVDAMPDDSKKPRRPPRRKEKLPDVPCTARGCGIATLVAVLAVGGGFYSHRRRKAFLASLAGPTGETVYDRGLVTRKSDAASVLVHQGRYNSNTTRRMLAPSLALGFASWEHPRTLEVVRRFGRKLTHFAPLRAYGVDAAGELSHLLPDGALRTLASAAAGSASGSRHAAAARPRLVPVVSLAGLDYARFFAGDEDSEAGEARGELLVALAREVRRRKLDGLVLDAHVYAAPLERTTLRAVLPQLHIFVQLLAHQLSQLDPPAELLLAVPPEHWAPRGSTKQFRGLFSKSQFDQLHWILGGFALATQNFSANLRVPGPSAPLEWVRAAANALAEPGSEDYAAAAAKLMVTVPLGGWDHPLPRTAAQLEVDGHGVAADQPVVLPPKPLSGAAYLDLLRAHRPRLEWVGDAAEHNFTYDDRGGAKHEVWHPTLKALAERLGHLRQLGVGVALWELGDGLDYFYDLI